jgi:hypothetical protein
MAVTSVSQCKVNDFGGNHDKLKIYWITGQSVTLHDHTTTVSIWCFVPATSTTPLGPHTVGLDVDDKFLPVPPFLMDDLCQPDNNPIPAKLRVLHEFHPASGSPLSVEEEHLFDVTCPPRGCDVAFVAKSGPKKGSKKKVAKKKGR